MPTKNGEIIAARAREHPNAVAVVFGEERLSYSELNRRSNQLAHYLKMRGVRADSLIGIFVERSLDMLVALLGVLKAGAAYVPLDPAYPKDRIAFIAEDAQLELLITQQSLVDSLPAHRAQVIRLDADWAAIAAESGDDPRKIPPRTGESARVLRPRARRQPARSRGAPQPRQRGGRQQCRLRVTHPGARARGRDGGRAAMTAFRRCSKSPRYFVPASSAPMSRE